MAMRPLSRPLTSISVASRNGWLGIIGAATITLLPNGTRSTGPHADHQRPVQPATRRAGGPLVAKVRRTLMAPSSHKPAQPSVELDMIETVMPLSGSVAVRET